MSPLHILHLSPPPSPLPAAFLFYLAVFAYSLHPFCGWICCGLSLFDFLLTWVFAGGASRCRLLLWRQSIWALGGKISEELQKYRDSLHLLQRPKLSDLEPISDISKERDSQRNNRQKRFNKGPPSLPIIGEHILTGLRRAAYEHFSICLNGKLKRGRLLFWPERIYTRP